MSNQTDPKIFQNITKPIKYRASYEKRDFTVTWKNWDDSILKTETVGMYMSATPPSDPTRTGYSFTGWDSGYSNISSNITVKAVFVEIEIISDIYPYEYGSENPANAISNSGRATIFPFIGEDMWSSGIFIFGKKSLSKTSFSTSTKDVPTDELIDASKVSIATSNTGITYRAATLDDFKAILGSKFSNYELIVNQLIGKAVRIINDNIYGNYTMTVSYGGASKVFNIFARLKAIMPGNSSWSTTEARISVQVLEGGTTGTQKRFITTLTELNEYTVDATHEVSGPITNEQFPHFVIKKANVSSSTYMISSKIANKYSSLTLDYSWQ